MTTQPWPCKHARHFTDWVPTPFGSGNCPMDSFECDYDGDKAIADPCNEDDTCAAYEPLEAAYCNKHAQPVKHVAGEPCWQCEDEAEAARDELEAAVLGRNDEGR